MKLSKAQIKLLESMKDGRQLEAHCFPDSKVWFYLKFQGKKFQQIHRRTVEILERLKCIKRRCGFTQAQFTTTVKNPPKCFIYDITELGYYELSKGRSCP